MINSHYIKTYYFWKDLLLLEVCACVTFPLLREEGSKLYHYTSLEDRKQ